MDNDRDVKTLDSDRYAVNRKDCDRYVKMDLCELGSNRPRFVSRIKGRDEALGTGGSFKF